MHQIRIAATFCVVFLVCGLCSAPWPGAWDERVVGKQDGAVWQTLWSFDHARKTAAGIQPLWQARDVNPPQGTALYPAASMLYPLLMAPATGLAGLLPGVNLAAWLALFLTFLCAYLFFWEISGDYWPGVLAAFAFACGPYALAEVGQGAVATGATFLIPLGAFFIVRLLDQGGVVYGLCTIAVSAAAVAYEPAYGLVLIFLCVLASIAALFDEGPRAGLRGLAAAGVTAVLLLPWIGGLDTGSWISPTVAPGRSLDMLEPIFFGRADSYLFPILPLVGAAVASFLTRSKRVFWWTAAALFYVVALGPKLTVWGAETGLGLPGALWSTVPGMPPIRDPYRFIVGVELALCALLAMGVREGLERLEGASRDESLATRGVLAVLIVAAVLMAPGDTVAPESNPVYERLGGAGTILELPFHAEPARNARYLFAQTQHERPVVCGPAFPGAPAEPFADLPYRHTLRALARLEADGIAAQNIRSAELSPFGVSHIVAHTTDMDAVAAGRLSAALTERFGPPIFSDATSAAWSVAAATQ